MGHYQFSGCNNDIFGSTFRFFPSFKSRIFMEEHYILFRNGHINGMYDDFNTVFVYITVISNIDDVCRAFFKLNRRCVGGSLGQLRNGISAISAILPKNFVQWWYLPLLVTKWLYITNIRVTPSDELEKNLLL